MLFRSDFAAAMAAQAQQLRVGQHHQPLDHQPSQPPAASPADAATDPATGPAGRRRQGRSSAPDPALLLQPGWNCRRGQELAIAFVRRHPAWRLSLQSHKWLGVR